MRIASLRLRLLAGLVDAAVAIGGVAAVVGAAVAGVLAYARVRGGEDGPGCDAPERLSEGHASGTLPQSPRLPAALSGASAGLAVAARNWRGPGFRVLGLRRVDANTGGSVTVRSGLLGLWFDQVWEAAVGSLFRARAQRQRHRIAALDPQRRAVERKYADDRQARRRAMIQLYKANDVNPFGAWGWLLAGPLLSHAILALTSRDGRTVRDRITGISVVVDR